MFKAKSFRVHWSMEKSLANDVVYFLNDNRINKEDIVSLKYFSENDCIYCILVWEDK